MTSTSLIGLIGSRICHDIISPLGAIGNGVELLSLSGSVPEAEMALVSDSVGNATAKVRFFRLAFGAAAPGQGVERSEILSILADLGAGGRLAYQWHPVGGADRQVVKAAFLALLCMETALVYGGEIEIRQMGDSWVITARHERITLTPELWQPLAQGDAPEALTANTVHFALLPDAVAEMGRELAVESGPDWALIRF